MGPSVNFSFCLAIHQELGSPSFSLRSGSLCHFQIHPVGDRGGEGPRLGTFQAVQGSTELR